MIPITDCGDVLVGNGDCTIIGSKGFGAGINAKGAIGAANINICT